MGIKNLSKYSNAEKIVHAEQLWDSVSKKEIEISEEVERELEIRIKKVLWYEELRIGLSYDFELSLEAGIDTILRNPNAFQKWHEDIKIRFISRFTYLIIVCKQSQMR